MSRYEPASPAMAMTASQADRRDGSSGSIGASAVGRAGGSASATAGAAWAASTDAMEGATGGRPESSGEVLDGILEGSTSQQTRGAGGRVRGVWGRSSSVLFSLSARGFFLRRDDIG